jgi:hypothetical protein
MNTTTQNILQGVSKFVSEVVGLVARLGYSWPGSRLSNHLGKSLTEAGNLTDPLG